MSRNWCMDAPGERHEGGRRHLTDKQNLIFLCTLYEAKYLPKRSFGVLDDLTNHMNSCALEN